MEAVEPQQFEVIDSVAKIKALTDPLRVRVLSLLCQRAATNQQVADALGEPHAKVLHHVRTLLDLGLIRLVETRIRGGNVEKYYRAVARMFGIRLRELEVGPDVAGGVASAEFEALRQEVVAAMAVDSGELPSWEGRHARLSAERLAEFHRRLLDLIAEYWGGPETEAPQDPTAPMMALMTVVYRDPTKPPPPENEG